MSDDVRSPVATSAAWAAEFVPRVHGDALIQQLSTLSYRRVGGLWKSRNRQQRRQRPNQPPHFNSGIRFMFHSRRFGRPCGPPKRSRQKRLREV
jgi:hypothetical protein